MRALLAVAHGRGHLEPSEKAQLILKYEEIARMLTGLIKYFAHATANDEGSQSRIPQGYPDASRIL